MLNLIDYIVLCMTMVMYTDKMQEQCSLRHNRYYGGSDWSAYW